MADISLSDPDHSELILLYDASVSEIAGFKQQQWAVTYYTLIVQAALVAAGQIIGTPLHDSERFILCAGAALSVGLGLTALRALQISVKARRERLRRVRESFGEAFKTAWAASKENDPVPCILVIAQATGALVVGWLIVAWL